MNEPQEKNRQPLLFDTGTSKEPVLISACFLGIPCRYHGRRAKRRDELIQKLKEKHVLVPICPEQLGGMPTPRTSETLPEGGTVPVQRLSNDPKTEDQTPKPEEK